MAHARRAGRPGPRGRLGAAGVGLALGAALALSPAAAQADELPWWNDRVFYEIFVRSFQDSDGDGVGDLEGLRQRLDHLNDGDPATTDDLGITGLWLMPITVSPSYHGYDVTDYYRVDPEYGTNEQFRELVEECHRRGIAVLVDLVLNHSSREHPWFVAADADPASEYRDYYVWSDRDPGYRGPWGQQAWHRGQHGWYYGVFWEGMPDLNYRNPATTRAAVDIARFWLQDMGADGFRLDAAKHIIEFGAQQENTNSTVRWLEGFTRAMHEAKPSSLLLGEVWSATPEVVRYIERGALDLAFEFSNAEALLQAAQSGRASSAIAAHTNAARSYPDQQFASFLANHDQVRAMQRLGGDPGKAKVAASMLLLGPGVPFLYYGEEIGMVGGKPDPRLRTPMHWAPVPGLGFTTGTPWEPPQDDWATRHVEGQAGEPGSLLLHYRALVQLRNALPALRRGSWDAHASGHPAVYAARRRHGDDDLLVLVNCGPSALARGELEWPAGYRQASVLLRSGPGGVQHGGPHDLPPYGTLVLRR